MPMQIGSFVNDQTANLGSRYEQFSISPAAMLIRVSTNHLGKPDVAISVECPPEETVNRIVVGFELLDEIAPFLRPARFRRKNSTRNLRRVHWLGKRMWRSSLRMPSRDKIRLNNVEGAELDIRSRDDRLAAVQSQMFI